MRACPDSTRCGAPQLPLVRNRPIASWTPDLYTPWHETNTYIYIYIIRPNFPVFAGKQVRHVFAPTQFPPEFGKHSRNTSSKIFLYSRDCEYRPCMYSHKTNAPRSWGACAHSPPRGGPRTTANCLLVWEGCEAMCGLSCRVMSCICTPVNV